MPDALAPWLPYALLPSNREAGRDKPAILKLRLPAGTSDWLSAFTAETVETEQQWPVDDVLEALADRAIAWHRHAADAKRTRAATGDELKQWIDRTRALADRLPFVGGTVQAMQTAAAQLERTLESPARLFARWPALGTTADATKRASLYLWAIDYLVRHLNDAEAEYARMRGGAAAYASPVEIWPALFDRDEPRPAFANYNEALKRVRNLEQTLQADKRDALMVNLLAAVLTPGLSRTS